MKYSVCDATIINFNIHTCLLLSVSLHSFYCWVTWVLPPPGWQGILSLGSLLLRYILGPLHLLPDNVSQHIQNLQWSIPMVRGGLSSSLGPYLGLLLREKIILYWYLPSSSPPSYACGMRMSRMQAWGWRWPCTQPPQKKHTGWGSILGMLSSECPCCLSTASASASTQEPSPWIEIVDKVNQYIFLIWRSWSICNPSWLCCITIKHDHVGSCKSYMIMLEPRYFYLQVQIHESYWCLLISLMDNVVIMCLWYLYNVYNLWTIVLY